MGANQNTEVYRRGIAGRFGLKLGQLTGGVVYLAGWYDHTGKRLGYGDLDSPEIERIAQELSDFELFVVLPPEEPVTKVINLDTSSGVLVLSEGYVPEYQEQLSLEALAARAIYIIGKDRIWFVDRDGFYAIGQEISRPSRNGRNRILRAICITPEHALRFITKKQTF